MLSVNLWTSLHIAQSIQPVSQGNSEVVCSLSLPRFVLLTYLSTLCWRSGNNALRSVSRLPPFLALPPRVKDDLLHEEQKLLTVDLVSGWWHSAELGCIVHVSEILTASIFKKKISIIMQRCNETRFESRNTDSNHAICICIPANKP